MRRAFPEGSSNLVHPADHYHPAANAESDWRQLMRRRVTWYPALALCRGRIVDMGCGPGIFGRMACDLGHDYHCGFDFSPYVIELARERCPHAFFAQVDLAQWWMCADTSWWVAQGDTVVLLEVLEHVYEDREILAAIPSGQTVVLSVPNFWTEGHCRWFKGIEQVVYRYHDQLDIDVALSEKSTNRRHWYYILKGRAR